MTLRLVAAQRRRLLSTALPMAFATALPACSLLPERTAQTYYRLDDANARPAATDPSRRKPLPVTLLVAPLSSNAVGNAYGMLYSRAAGERAYYQYNEWTDRPTLRVAQLLVDRLDARHAFAAVVPLGSGVSGDLVANVVVDDLVHDLSGGGAGVGRITVQVDLIDRRARRLLGRRTFIEASAATTANAAGAAAAMNRAATAFLDAASSWIESVAADGGQ